MASSNPVLDTIADIPSVITNSPLDEVQKIIDDPIQMQDLQARMAEEASQAKEDVRRINENTAAIMQNTESMVASIEAAAAPKKIIAQETAVAAMQVEDQLLENDIAAGGPQRGEFLLRERQKTVDELLAVQDRIADISDDRITKVGILDDIINSARISFVRPQERALQRKLGTVTRATVNRTAALDATAKAANLAKQTITEGTIQAGLDLIDLQTTEQASAARIAGANSNSEAVVRTSAMRRRTLENSFKLQNLAFSERQIELQERQQLITASAKSDAEDVQKKVAAVTNAGRAILNVPQMDPDVISFQTKHGTATQKAQHAAAANVGVSPKGNPTYGANPKSSFDTVALFDTTGEVNPSPHVERLYQIPQLMEQDYIAQGDQLALRERPKNQQEFDAHYNEVAHRLRNIDTRLINEQDPRNLAKAPPFSVLAGSSQAIQETEGYQKILRNANISAYDSQLIMNTLMEGVTAGIIGTRAAIEAYVTTAQAAVEYNNANFGGYTSVGLPPQQSYIVALKRSPTFFESVTTNLGKVARASLVGAPPGAFSDSAPTARFFNVDSTDVVQVTEYVSGEVSGRRFTPSTAADVGIDIPAMRAQGLSPSEAKEQAMKEARAAGVKDVDLVLSIGIEAEQGVRDANR